MEISPGIQICCQKRFSKYPVESTLKKGYKPSIFMKISKSALDKILSLFVPVNRAQILYKTMKKPTVMLLFSGSCCERVVRSERPVFGLDRLDFRPG